MASGGDLCYMDFGTNPGRKKGIFLHCMTCGNVGWCNYICKGFKACKTSNYILTKFLVKPVQILKSDRFCGIIKTE